MADLDELLAARGLLGARGLQSLFGTPAPSHFWPMSDVPIVDQMFRNTRSYGTAPLNTYQDGHGVMAGAVLKQMINP